MSACFSLGSMCDRGMTFYDLCFAGDQVEGYVSWDPDQSLNTTFRLLVEKVYICTGTLLYNPYIPTQTPEEDESDHMQSLG